MDIRRYDMVLADLSGAVGSEQGGTRPVLIVQNNVGNLKSPTTIVAPITKSQTKAIIPTHFEIDLKYPSTVMLEQIFTVNKNDLETFIRDLTDEEMNDLNRCLKISIGL